MSGRGTFAWIALFASFALDAHAVPQVVSDEACRVNAAGVAEFATCEDGKAPLQIGVDPPGARAGSAATAPELNKESKRATRPATQAVLRRIRDAGDEQGRAAPPARDLRLDTQKKN